MWRSALLCSAALVITSGASSAWAQTGAPAGDKEQAAEVEEIIVTGSRIRRDTFNSPVPIAVVGAEDIRSSGNVILGDVLMDVPAVAASSNAQNTSSTLFNSGQARIDLRAMGASRTLVLMDGRRHVFSDAASPAVDLNMIPSMMVERVDVVPGAGGAIYGSEAISGVVNLVMKKKFDGLEFDVQSGISQEGDGEEWRAAALYGNTFLDDRLNFVIGAEMARSEPIMQIDRDWGYPGIRRNTGVPAGSPQTIIGSSRSNTTPTGTFQLGNGYSIALDPSRNVVRLSPDCTGATVKATCQDDALFYTAEYNALQNNTERGSVRTYLDYQLTDDIKAFAEFSYARAEGYGIFQPAFSSAAGGGTMPVVLKGDNAFLNDPTNARAAALRDYWTASGKGFTNASTAQVGKFWNEFGGRNVDTSRETLRAVIGMEGRFSALDRNFNWDWYYQVGKLDGETTSYGVPYVKRVQAATDAIVVGGETVCRITVTDPTNPLAPGCVPWDLINGPSAAAVAWASGQSTTVSDATQKVAAINLATDLIELPAGPLGMAIGAEYRYEESNFVQDEAGKNGELFFNSIGTRGGDYDVKEAYVEFRAPILRDLPLAEELTVEAAGRLSNYSSIGDADQWRLALQWTPVQDIRFRASKGTAVRAPNIVELNAPQSRNFTTAGIDPCDKAAYATASAEKKARRDVNCKAAIAGWDPATFDSNFGPGKPSLALWQGGNKDLDAEEAMTTQIGVVIQPRIIPNLQLSFDHFDMQLDGAVSTLPLNTLLADLCYDSATAYASNPFCSLIVRYPSGDPDNPAGGVKEVFLTNLNVATIKVKGYDASIGYRFDVADLFGGEQDMGKLSLRLDVTRMYAWKLQGQPAAKFTDLTNNLGNASPEWKANFSANYAWRDMTLGWATRFYGSAIPVTGSSAAALDPYYTGDYFMHDLKASYRLNDQVKLRGGIVNVTDENPPYLPEVYTGTGTGASIYDNRGRFFYLGATLSY